MRKIAVSFIILCMLLVASAGMAEDYREMFYERAKVLMTENSTLLKRLDKAVRDARRRHLDSVRRAENSDGDMPRDELRSLSKMYELRLTPRQTEHAWKTSVENYAISENLLEFGLRDLFVRLYRGFNNYNTQKKKLEMAEVVFKGKERAYGLRLIGELEFEQVGQSLLEQGILVRKAGRDLENLMREFNSYIGVDINGAYDIINITEKPAEIDSLESYLSRALKNRAEIVRLERQINLLELQKDIMDRNGAHGIYTSIAREYNSLLDEAERLKAQLERARLSVEQDIRNAYVEVTAAAKELEIKMKQAALAESRLASMRILRERGMISGHQWLNAEIAANEARSSMDAAIFEFNTLVMRLKCASGPGPGFN
jgi:outer membrane protein TolC